jgi:hypothetical protein
VPPVLTFPLETRSGQSPVRKRAEFVLELLTRGGAWRTLLFRVDTGAELCVMSAARAQPSSAAHPLGLDLATALAPRTVQRNLADGSTRTVVVQFGTLTARFPQLPRFVFTWECVFDPTVPPSATPLLGIGGRVLSDVSLALRGSSREHPAGALAVELLVSPLPLFPPAA